MISYILSIALTVAIFTGTLLLFGAKTCTIHICLKREFWRFERFITRPKGDIKDTIYTVYLGPVAFVVVR